MGSSDRGLRSCAAREARSVIQRIKKQHPCQTPRHPVSSKERNEGTADAPGSPWVRRIRTGSGPLRHLSWLPHRAARGCRRPAGPPYAVSAFDKSAAEEPRMPLTCQPASPDWPRRVAHPVEVGGVERLGAPRWRTDMTALTCQRALAGSCPAERARCSRRMERRRAAACPAAGAPWRYRGLSLIGVDAAGMYVTPLPSRAWQTSRCCAKARWHLDGCAVAAAGALSSGAGMSLAVHRSALSQISHAQQEGANGRQGIRTL